MIDSKDLRIGNLVMVNQKMAQGTFSVVRISSNTVYVNTMRPIDLSLDEIHPIPITEEMLIEFGWIWNKDCNSFEKHPNGDARMNLTYNSPSGSWTMFNYVLKALIANKIFYIHQLQNLFYALTGQELTINKECSLT